VFNWDNKTKIQMGRGLAVALVLLFAAASAEAAYVDLTTLGSTGTINGAIFNQSSTGSGTGIFPAFVQITGNNSPHSAYNTTENGVFDNGSADNFNKTITIGDLTTTTVGGVAYYQFFLDVNENNNAADRYLSLDILRVFYGGAANQSTLDVTAPTTLGTQAYDMGAGNGVLLDFNLEPGSGKADMTFLVPVANFGGAGPTTTVTLYSSFGSLGTTCSTTISNPTVCRAGADYGASDGFEEWAFQLTGTTVIPEPSTYALYALGISMLFVSGWWQKRRTALGNSSL
jgi:hypothetical protein